MSAGLVVNGRFDAKLLKASNVSLLLCLVLKLQLVDDRQVKLSVLLVGEGLSASSSHLLISTEAETNA